MRTIPPAKLASLVALALGLAALASCGGNPVTTTGGPTGTGAGNTTSSGTQGAGADGGGGGAPVTDDDGDGYTEADGDCNDANANIHPGAVEICQNNIDDDCDGQIDESLDKDQDGFGSCSGDCNDDDPAVNPAAAEVADGIDNDCDGVVDADYDGDGYTDAQGDCDDNDPERNPGAKEDCFDGIDNDCNGLADAAEADMDGDGVGPCAGDCDDGNPMVSPNLPEIPGDGVDNDCDNLVDADIDADGWTAENGDCNDNNPNVNPAILEVCGDGVDNNCNGEIDTDCLSPCDLADLFASSVGCLYYAVDANNDPPENYDALPYAVAVSNVDPSASATVEVQTRSGNVWTTIQSAQVAPNSLQQFNLPDRHVDYTNINVAGAYRVISDLPIIAYQFQPINGATSFTSDASLLLPRSALDRFYYIAGWGKPSFGNAQIVIVAAEDGTQVTVTPSVATAAGGPIPALPANQPYTFPQLLNAGDYIQLDAPNGSFTGSYITADKPISVFSANWCANIPQQVCCCDHLEEQVIGLQTWGKTYVASRMPVRSSGTPDATYWHVLASEDQTTVNFIKSPGVTGLPAGAQVLNKGQALTLGVTGTAQNPGDFIVNADKPIFVMEYLTSSAATNAPAATAGDPAMTQVVPVEQFLDKYVVLVPTAWIYDFFILTKPIGSTITIDGAPVGQNQFIPINDGVNPPQWEVARITMADGVHVLDGTAPFGVVVVGYDQYDSYAYPGGLNQKVINPMN